MSERVFNLLFYSYLDEQNQLNKCRIDKTYLTSLTIICDCDSIANNPPLIFVFGEYQYTIPIKYLYTHEHNECHLIIKNSDYPHTTIGNPIIKLFQAIHFDFETNSISFFSNTIQIEKSNEERKNIVIFEIKPMLYFLFVILFLGIFIIIIIYYKEL